MDLAALNAEIATDPQAKGYAAHLPNDPVRVADLLNALTETMVKPITAAKALTWAAGGPMAAIVDTATTTGHPARASCLAFLRSLDSGMDIAMDDSAIQALFAGWVQAGVIVESDHSGLMQIATQPASRAEVLGLGIVTARDIVDSGAL
jgi:hypothetical protein